MTCKYATPVRSPSVIYLLLGVVINVACLGFYYFHVYLHIPFILYKNDNNNNKKTLLSFFNSTTLCQPLAFVAVPIRQDKQQQLVGTIIYRYNIEHFSHELNGIKIFSYMRQNLRNKCTYHVLYVYCIDSLPEYTFEIETTFGLSRRNLHGR